MPYAVSNGGRSWRAIHQNAELLPGETYSETRPPELPPIPPTAAELAALARVKALRLRDMTPNQAAAWIERQVQDGNTEAVLKEIAELLLAVRDEQV